MRSLSSFLVSLRPWWKRLGWAVATLLLLWALAWLVVPRMLPSQIERLASERLGRQVSVGRVEFSLWSLELRVHDLAMATADGKGSQARIGLLYIDAELQSLWRLAPVVGAVQIEAPHLRVARTADGRYDIDDVLERLRTPDTAPKEPAQPPRFSLYNIAVHGGTLEFDDQAVGRVHTVQHAELAIPFLSNLPADREVKVAPRLAFELNGSPFESQAVATPFADGRRAEVRLQLQGFDLAPFAGYVPESLPLRLQAGALDAELQLTFEQAQVPTLRITGQAGLRDVRLVDTRGREQLAFDALQVGLRDVQPLQRIVRLDEVQWRGVRTDLRRNADGALDLPGWPMAAATKPKPAAAAAPAPWQFSLDSLAVEARSLAWTDASLGAEPARWALGRLSLQAADLAWPVERPARFHGLAELADSAAGAAPGQLTFHGEATDRKASVALSVRQWPLASAAPYLQGVLQPRLVGTLAADLGLAWNGPAMAAKVAQLSIEGAELRCAAKSPCAGVLESTAAGQNRGDGHRLAQWQRLEVADALVRWPARQVTVGRLALVQPRLAMSRAADGRWMFQDWQRPVPASEAAAKGSAPSPAPPPWSLRIAELAVDDGAVQFRDLSRERPVAVQVSSIQLRLREVEPLAQTAAPSPISFSAQIGAGRTEPGRLQFEGTAGWAPVAVQGQVRARQLPLHAFEPYVSDQLNATVVRAEGSFTGEVRHAVAAEGATTSVRGDAALDEVRVRSAVLGDAAAPATRVATGRRGEELLNWKTLALRGLDVQATPGRPVAVEVKATALSDFFARVIVQENGRINLQDLRKNAAAQDAAAQAGAPAAQVPGQVSAAQAAAAESPGASPLIRFGPITLTGGAVRFTDYFVKPNYSADLSELAGRLSAFASQAPGPGQAPEMADLELRGRAEGTASLEVTGKLNPLAKPLALDIQGRMRDLELPPLSPYAVKYAGHGIERGKLSMDVTYRVLPDGQLTASNKLVLHQLAFGEPVEGAPASLPVRLAVALLADRNGVIDVDLPISGSLNDPQFSVGGVILRVIGNLVMKAITSPFSLLAGGWGGSQEMETVAFAPGSAELDAPARQMLDKVAQALQDRPALQMTVVGQARLDAEREAWKRSRLQSQVQAQKRRLAVRAGQAAADVAPVTPQEYPAMLKELYTRTDLDGKPRNLIGLSKDLPVPEMEALLLAHIAVPDNAMRDLAVARGVAVRDYLAQRQVPLDRLFVGAVRTDPPDGPDRPWAPQAALTLATR